MDGDNAIKALAQAVDKNTTAYPGTTLALATGWIQAAYPLTAHRINGFILITGRVQRTSGSAGLIATLTDTKLRTGLDMLTPGVAYTSGTAGGLLCTVNFPTDGTITFAPVSANTAREYICGDSCNVPRQKLGGIVGYQTPADVPISDTWQGHKNRNPPSPEPGTDYATAYGTDIRMAESGTVSVVDTSPSGGEGRRLSIDLDDGRRVSYLHLSEIRTSVGKRVSRGQKGCAISGASGNGQNWYYGPHCHVSLWDHPGMPYASTIDFAKYVGAPPVPPAPPESEDDMPKNSGFYYTRSSDKKTVWLVCNPASGFQLEWSDSSMTIDDIAAAFDTGPFARITEGMRGAVVGALNDVQHLDVKPAPAGDTLSASRGALAVLAGLGLLVLVVIVLQVVQLVG